MRIVSSYPLWFAAILRACLKVRPWESPIVRLAALCACALAATPAVAEELGAKEAWAFMLGKPFSLTCADGTVGEGRLFPDGSVVGKIRVGSQGEMRSGTLPAGTVRVTDTELCAYFQGLPIPPCLNVQKIDRRRFHASLSILGFSYCQLDSLISRPLRRAR